MILNVKYSIEQQQKKEKKGLNLILHKKLTSKTDEF